MRLTLAILGLLLLSDAASACGIIEGWPAYWVDNADVIVRARAVEQRDRAMSEADVREASAMGYIRSDRRMSTVRFALVETLKGRSPSVLEFDGELISGGSAVDPSVPRSRGRQDGSWSTCFSHSYRPGVEYLMMLEPRNGTLTPYWASSAATNEPISGDKDPWLRWVRDYIALRASGVAGTVRAACETNMDIQPEKLCRFTEAWVPYSIDGLGNLTREYRQSARLPVPDGRSIHSVAFAEYDGDLILTYEASDAHSGVGEMVRLDAKTLALKWRLTIPAFNISLAIIESGRAYVAGIGLVAAVDLETGGFLWKHAGLYDRARFSFNAFERPIVGSSHVTFVEARSDNQKPRRIVVDKTTGQMRIEALAGYVLR